MKYEYLIIFSIYYKSGHPVGHYRNRTTLDHAFGEKNDDEKTVEALAYDSLIEKDPDVKSVNLENIIKLPIK